MQQFSKWSPHLSDYAISENALPRGLIMGQATRHSQSYSLRLGCELRVGPVFGSHHLAVCGVFTIGHGTSRSRWSNNCPGTLRTDWSELPNCVAKKGVSRKPASTAFPMIGWRRDDLIMIECKRAGADSLGPNQDAWMHCAILSGCRREQLGVFEWRFGHGN
jgi:hypothetical protein